MTKLVTGSFIVHCDKGSPVDIALNCDVPIYHKKEVCIIQLECIIYGEGLRMIYELIYRE